MTRHIILDYHRYTTVKNLKYYRRVLYTRIIRANIYSKSSFLFMICTILSWFLKIQKLLHKCVELTSCLQHIYKNEKLYGFRNAVTRYRYGY